MTRLRLTLNDPAAVDEARLKALGARGVVRPGGKALQVVLGLIADQVAGEIRASLHGAPAVDAGWLDAIGGPDNLEDVQLRSTRVILSVADVARLDEKALKRLGARVVARSDGGRIHLLLDETDAQGVAALLQPA